MSNTLTAITLTGITVALVALVIYKRKNRGPLTYKEVMEFVIAHKNDDPSIVKAALCRDKDDRNCLAVTYLDAKGELVCDSAGNPLGCKMKAPEWEPELLNLFNTNDLVIVE
jgi:hypothetical protein